MDTNPSNFEDDALLSQEIDRQEKVLSYYSRDTLKPERNYCVTRRKLLAVVDELNISTNTSMPTFYSENGSCTAKIVASFLKSKWSLPHSLVVEHTTGAASI